ncbi:uncharacterized protein JCM15063_001424 [Sporobolomyces koalae]|uniref:uncharacterized protein n=1 Tax=Sporobolomyces koalae TaxID=500713 RepID=UPI003174FC0B
MEVPLTMSPRRPPSPKPAPSESMLLIALTPAPSRTDNHQAGRATPSIASPALNKAKRERLGAMLNDANTPRFGKRSHLLIDQLTPSLRAVTTTPLIPTYSSLSPARSPFRPVHAYDNTPVRVAETPATKAFRCFSPATPLVRTHSSYEPDELTDCDADFSTWDDDDISFTRPPPQQDLLAQQDVVEANQPEQTTKFEDEGSTASETELEDELEVRSESEGELAVPDCASEEVAVPGNEIETAAPFAQEPAVIRPSTPDLQASALSNNHPSPLFTASPSPAENRQVAPPQLGTSVTPTRSAIVPSASQPLQRSTQTLMHEVPAARRQMSKSSAPAGLSSKRSLDSLDQDSRCKLTEPTEARTICAGRNQATLDLSTSCAQPTARIAAAVPPPPSSSSAASRTRTISDSRLSTIDETLHPARPASAMSSFPSSKLSSSKLSSSLPPSSTSTRPATASTLMRPPTSTIPRPKTLLARSGIKPPGTTMPTTKTLPATASRLAAPSSIPTTKNSLAVTASKSTRALATPLTSRTTAAASANRTALQSDKSARQALPSLAKTTSAPSVLASSTSSSSSATTTTHTSRAHTAPPVPAPVVRSARPANLVRSIPESTAASFTAPNKLSSQSVPSTVTGEVVRISSPLKRRSQNPAIRPTNNQIEPEIAAPLPNSPVRDGRSTPPPRSPRVRKHPNASCSSPLPSPRRVPLTVASNLQETPATALSLPADQLESSDTLVKNHIFASNSTRTSASVPSITTTIPIRSSRPIRKTRTTTVQPEEETQRPAVPVVPVKRVTRRTAAAAAAAAAAIPATTVANSSTLSSVSTSGTATTTRTARLVPRSSRRPPVVTKVPETIETVTDGTRDAENDSRESEPTVANPSTASSSILALFVTRPAPVLTQEELNRLTQRNTKKNQQVVNKLKIETVFLSENRPPSPTSKIRKSFGANGTTAEDEEQRKKDKIEVGRESRELRAAKRRRALRSSTDGTELETIQSELSQISTATAEEDVTKVDSVSMIELHYRAPGDEEQFMTPMKPTLKKKNNLTKITTGQGRDDSRVERKSVRWHKALVFEATKETSNSSSTSSSASSVAASNSIIKTKLLDQWGNSTETSSNHVKPTPVVICKRVFKDDEEHPEH